LGGIGEGHFFGGRAEHRGNGHYQGWGEPDAYYGDSGYYEPSTIPPDEQPTAAPDEQPPYPTTAYPSVKPPRSRCSTQTYKVPSEAGGEASVNVVRC
jgi:hypothetical protein